MSLGPEAGGFMGALLQQSPLTRPFIQAGRAGALADNDPNASFMSGFLGMPPGLMSGGTGGQEDYEAHKKAGEDSAFLEAVRARIQQQSMPMTGERQMADILRSYRR